MHLHDKVEVGRWIKLVCSLGYNAQYKHFTTIIWGLKMVTTVAGLNTLCSEMQISSDCFFYLFWYLLQPHKVDINQQNYSHCSVLSSYKITCGVNQPGK